MQHLISGIILVGLVLLVAYSPTKSLAVPTLAESQMAAAAGITDYKIEKQAIKLVITTMNKAVTEGNLEGVLATFDDNALKMDLFPAHYPKFANNTAEKSAKQAPLSGYPKTARLKDRWQAVFAIMTGRSYERKVEKMDIQVDGTMASAWVNIHTKTVSRDKQAKVNNNSFYELVVLKKIQGQWKIMLTSNNRHDR